MQFLKWRKGNLSLGKKVGHETKQLHLYRTIFEIRYVQICYKDLD